MQQLSNYDELMKEDKYTLVTRVKSLEERLAKYEDKHLSKKEAAEELRMSISTLDRLINNGLLEARKRKPGVKQSTVEIPYSAIIKYRHRDEQKAH
jgi:orotate phosphoribosyltransferase-like protein